MGSLVLPLILLLRIVLILHNHQQEGNVQKNSEGHVVQRRGLYYLLAMLSCTAWHAGNHPPAYSMGLKSPS